MEISLKSKYQDIKPKLKEQYNYSNVMATPKLEKIVLNMGLGSEARDDSKVIERANKEFSLIALQRPVVTKAKKSVSNFKLRAGMPIGLKTTLRGDRMWIFLDKLINVALPRVRDFRGLKLNSFDGRGNYSLGIREQLIFPEITYDMIDKTRGMDVTIITTAKTDEEAKSLLEFLGMPFKESRTPWQLKHKLPKTKRKPKFKVRQT